jgi:DNA uptake protein ComE-like DNA-binding protein
MNLQTSNRRQDLPVRLGNHGYQLDGDFAVLNAELHVPPYFTGSSFGLELWACAAPHIGGALEGVKVAEISLDLPTPIGPHVQHVEARTVVNPPAGSGDHTMVLVLVDGSGEARRVHDYANFEQLQHFANPVLEGSVAYSVVGDDVVLAAESISNPRPDGSSSGTLCLELWASSEPYSGGIPRGHRLAGAELGSIWGQYHLANVSRRVAFTAPPPGRWHVALLLREWSAVSGYAPRSHRNFDVVYVQPSAAPSPAPFLATPATAPRSAEKLRLVKPAAVAEAAAEASSVAAAPAPSTPAPSTPAEATPEGVAPAAVAPVAPAAVAAPAAAAHEVAVPTGKTSVHTASVEDLAKLPGLNLKIAKEIVKRRPFASLEALVDVRGIGEKSLRRIKALLTL